MPIYFQRSHENNNVLTEEEHGGIEERYRHVLGRFSDRTSATIPAIMIETMVVFLSLSY
jgi:hypothetical protein